ncbi:MAG: Crp/Fnr family transcriptional regulator [Proteobacteria bacterium]|nr:Crp/Fnr family transcriptional regulator [Pseudomonadota bacterium]
MVRVVDPLVRRLRNLGLDSEEELRAILPLLKFKGRINRGEDIVQAGSSPHYSTVLLEGAACRYKITENGRRQIFTFRYSGDLCDFSRYMLPESDEAIAALSECTVAIVRHEDLQRAAALYPNLSFALWRDAMLEASIFRERLVNIGQRPALPRIANLICEQMIRLEAAGLDASTIPLTQVDLADAAALSTVHMNRTIQDLRELGVLAKSTRGIEVVHRDRLFEIAKFDGRYLNLPQHTMKWMAFLGTQGHPLLAA